MGHPNRHERMKGSQVTNLDVVPAGLLVRPRVEGIIIGRGETRRGPGVPMNEHAVGLGWPRQKHLQQEHGVVDVVVVTRQKSRLHPTVAPIQCSQLDGEKTQSAERNQQKLLPTSDSKEKLNEPNRQLKV